MTSEPSPCGPPFRVFWKLHPPSLIPAALGLSLNYVPKDAGMETNIMDWVTGDLMAALRSDSL